MDIGILLASFIFTTNNCATVLGPFPELPATGVTTNGETVSLCACDRPTRESCHWFELDESDRPVLHSNEVVRISGYARTAEGYKASYSLPVCVPKADGMDPWFSNRVARLVTDHETRMWSASTNAFVSGWEGRTNLTFSGYVPWVAPSSETNYGYAVTIGGRATNSIGAASFAVGQAAVASGRFSVALGRTAAASGTYSIAAGTAAKAKGSSSVALGAGTAEGNSSIAAGLASTSVGSGSVAVGTSSVASNKQSMAVGVKAYATNDYSIVINAMAPSGAAYGSHGPRTVSIGATNDIDGVWIGEKTLRRHIEDTAVGTKYVYDLTNETGSVFAPLRGEFLRTGDPVAGSFVTSSVMPSVGNRLQSLAGHGKVLVAGSYGTGALLYSKDFGRTWSRGHESRGGSTPGTWTVRWCGDRFLAGSPDFPVGALYSTDGETWYEPGDHISGRFTGFAYSAGVWYATSSEPGIYVTTDPAGSWEAEPAPVRDLSFPAICGGGGRVLAFSDDGYGVYKVFSRLDGATDWLECATRPPHRFTTVAYGKGGFVASSPDSDGLYRSEDGQSWNRVDTPSVGYSCVSYCEETGMFVATASNGSSGLTYTSPDGLSWSSFANVGGDVCVAGLNSYVIHDATGTYYAKALGYDAMPVVQKILFNGREVGPGTDGVAVVSNVVRISDVVNSAGDRVSDLYGVDVKNGKPGERSTWRGTAAPAAGYSDAISLGNGVFLASLDDTSRGMWGVLVTRDDMSTWHEVSGIPSGPCYFAAREGIVVVVSKDDGATYYSTDLGVTWTQADCRYYGVPMSSARCLDGVFFSCSPEYTSLFVSPDGTTWVPSASGPRRWTDIAYGDGKHVAFGQGSRDGLCVAVSTDGGATWSSAAGSPQVSAENARMCYGKGLFLLATEGDGMFWSDNGTVWHKCSIPVDVLSGVAYGGGRFLATAHHGGGVFWSDDGKIWNRAFSGEFAGAWGYESGFLANEVQQPLGLMRSEMLVNHVVPVVQRIRMGDDVYDVDAENVVTLPSSGAGGTKVSDLVNDAGHRLHDMRSDIFPENPAGVLWEDRADGAIDACSIASDGKGTVVCCHAEDGIFYSTDKGVSWRKVNPDVDVYRGKWSVAYGNGRFVAACCSDARGIWKSSDGVAWLPTSQSTGQWGFAKFVNGKFYAGGLDGTGLFRSDDGDTGWYSLGNSGREWSSQSRHVLDVAVSTSGDRLVFLTEGGDFPIVFSEDGGESWVGVFADDLPYRGQLRSVEYAFGRFFASREDSDDTLVSSAEGYEWTRVADPVVYGQGGILCFNGTKLVCGFYGSPYKTFYSGNGASWTVTDHPDRSVHSLCSDSTGSFYGGSRDGFVLYSAGNIDPDAGFVPVVQAVSQGGRTVVPDVHNVVELEATRYRMADLTQQGVETKTLVDRAINDVGVADRHCRLVLPAPVDGYSRDFILIMAVPGETWMPEMFPELDTMVLEPWSLPLPDFGKADGYTYRITFTETRRVNGVARWEVSAVECAGVE